MYTETDTDADADADADATTTYAVETFLSILSDKILYYNKIYKKDGQSDDMLIGLILVELFKYFQKKYDIYYDNNLEILNFTYNIHVYWKVFNILKTYQNVYNNINSYVIIILKDLESYLNKHYLDNNGHLPTNKAYECI
jgi:hypothetical protein